MSKNAPGNLSRGAKNAEKEAEIYDIFYTLITFLMYQS